MKEYAEKENAKPEYFARDDQVFKRGSTTYNEDKDTCSQGLHIAICVITEYLENQEEVAEYIAKSLNTYSLTFELVNAMEDVLKHYGNMTATKAGSPKIEAYHAAMEVINKLNKL